MRFALALLFLGSSVFAQEAFVEKSFLGAEEGQRPNFRFHFGPHKKGFDKGEAFSNILANATGVTITFKKSDREGFQVVTVAFLGTQHEEKLTAEVSDDAVLGLKLAHLKNPKGTVFLKLNGGTESFSRLYATKIIQQLEAHESCRYSVWDTKAVLPDNIGSDEFFMGAQSRTLPRSLPTRFYVKESKRAYVERLLEEARRRVQELEGSSQENREAKIQREREKLREIQVEISVHSSRLARIQEPDTDQLSELGSEFKKLGEELVKVRNRTRKAIDSDPLPPAQQRVRRLERVANRLKR